MLGISLDLGWASQMALDQYSRGDPTCGHCGRIKQRLAGDIILRLPDVGNNRLLRLHRTSRSSGESNGGAHERQEFPPRLRIIPVWRAIRKFVVDESAKLFRLR